MTSEPLKTETEIDLDQLDSREFPKLDRASLEKIAAALAAKGDSIKEQNRDRLTEATRLQTEVETESSKLPSINGSLLAAKKILEKLEVESNLIEDVKLFASDRRSH
jgi:hypothetical protein